MFFSLTAWGPASLGLPPPRDHSFGSALLRGPHARRTAVREGGMEGGWLGGSSQAWHCPALCLLLSAATLPLQARPAHPAPTGVPSPSGPGLLAGVLLTPRAPGHVLGTATAHPALPPAQRRAWHRARLPGSPARAGWGAGRGAPVPAEGEAQMPSQPEGPPPASRLLSPIKAQTTRAL